MCFDSVYNVRVCFGIYRTDNMNESLSFMCDKASFAVASIKDDTHSFILIMMTQCLKLLLNIRQ